MASSDAHNPLRRQHKMQLQLNFTFDSGLEFAEFARAIGPVLSSFQAAARPIAPVALPPALEAAHVAANVEVATADEAPETSEPPKAAPAKRGRPAKVQPTADALPLPEPAPTPVQAAPPAVSQPAAPVAPPVSIPERALTAAPANYDAFRPEVMNFVNTIGVGPWNAFMGKHGFKTVGEIAAKRDGETEAEPAARIAAIWPAMCEEIAKAKAAKAAAKAAGGK